MENNAELAIQKWEKFLMKQKILQEFLNEYNTEVQSDKDYNDTLASNRSISNDNFKWEDSDNIEAPDILTILDEVMNTAFNQEVTLDDSIFEKAEKIKLANATFKKYFGACNTGIVGPLLQSIEEDTINLANRYRNERN